MFQDAPGEVSVSNPFIHRQVFCSYVSLNGSRCLRTTRVFLESVVAALRGARLNARVCHRIIGSRGGPGSAAAVDRRAAQVAAARRSRTVSRGSRARRPSLGLRGSLSPTSCVYSPLLIATTTRQTARSSLRRGVLAYVNPATTRTSSSSRTTSSSGCGRTFWRIQRASCLLREAMRKCSRIQANAIHAWHTRLSLHLMTQTNSGSVAVYYTHRSTNWPSQNIMAGE